MGENPYVRKTLISEPTLLRTTGPQIIEEICETAPGRVINSPIDFMRMVNFICNKVYKDTWKSGMSMSYGHYNNPTEHDTPYITFVYYSKPAELPSMNGASVYKEDFARFRHWTEDTLNSDAAIRKISQFIAYITFVRVYSTSQAECQKVSEQMRSVIELFMEVYQKNGLKYCIWKHTTEPNIPTPGRTQELFYVETEYIIILERSYYVAHDIVKTITTNLIGISSEEMESLINGETTSDDLFEEHANDVVSIQTGSTGAPNTNEEIDNFHYLVDYRNT